jgi:hypothetical protein
MGSDRHAAMGGEIPMLDVTRREFITSSELHSRWWMTR